MLDDCFLKASARRRPALKQNPKKENHRTSVGLATVWLRVNTKQTNKKIVSVEQFADQQPGQAGILVVFYITFPSCLAWSRLRASSRRLKGSLACSAILDSRKISWPPLLQAECRQLIGVSTTSVLLLMHLDLVASQTFPNVSLS